MSRRPALITQADVARAIRAAQQCGAGMVQIRPDGTIYVMTGPPVLTTEPSTETQPPAVEPPRKVVL
jgi:hypothetical protein